MPVRICHLCELEPSLSRRTRCYECWVDGQPIMRRMQERDFRLSLVPEAWRVARVPKEQWPPGRRWCAGCQSFVQLKHCAEGASRCRTCASVAGHASHVKGTYGIDADAYNDLMNLQGGRCAICRTRPKNDRLVVDHDHKTGAVRGLLCKLKCNHELLGGAKEDIDILRNAVYYLEHPPMSGDWVGPEERRGEEKPAPF